MPSMDVLERLREVATQALTGQGVAFAYLFGSHALDRATPRSDIDVAVHLTEEARDPLSVASRVAGLLERATGLGPIEVVVLDNAPIALSGRIREHGRLIVQNDEVVRVRWDSLTARKYHDFRVHEQRSARERLAALASD